MWVLSWLFKSLKMLNICCHTGSNGMVYHQCGFFHSFSRLPIFGICSYTGNSWKVFHRCGFFHASAMLLNFTGHFSDWQKESQTDQNNETFTNNMNKYKYDWGWQVSSYSLTCMYLAGKSAECDEQQCFPMCDNSSLYMYFKKLSFSGFSLPDEPEIRIFFNQNMPLCIRLNLRH